jgi:hypothetical protein
MNTERTTPENGSEIDLRYLGAGIVAGAALGIASGMVLNSPPIVALGAGTGVAIGMGASATTGIETSHRYTDQSIHH